MLADARIMDAAQSRAAAMIPTITPLGDVAAQFASPAKAGPAGADLLDGVLEDKENEEKDDDEGGGGATSANSTSALVPGGCSFVGHPAADESAKLALVPGGCSFDGHPAAAESAADAIASELVEGEDEEECVPGVGLPA